LTADTAPAKTASDAAKAQTPGKAAPAQAAQEPAPLAAATAAETSAPIAAVPEEHGPAAPAKPKGDPGAARAGSGDQPPQAAAPPTTDAPAEQPIKPVTQQAQAAERPAQPAPAEARSDSANAPAPISLGAANNNAPVVPFHIAAQPILPTISPLTALRVEMRADNAVPIAGLAVEIVARSQDGSRRFEIRLDPPELGRIDVRLDVDQTGKVTSRLMVERTETLDLLRRDAPQLERALQHAGLNPEGGLEFSLRDQSFANRDQQRDSTNASRLIIPDDEPHAAEAARRGYGRMIGLGGGVDIRV